MEKARYQFLIIIILSEKWEYIHFHIFNIFAPQIFHIKHWLF